MIIKSILNQSRRQSLFAATTFLISTSSNNIVTLRTTKTTAMTTDLSLSKKSTTMSMTLAATTPSVSLDASVDRGFYVLARERGTVRDDLPLWTSKQPDPFNLAGNMTDDNNNKDQDGRSCQAPPNIERKELFRVPGAFQILNVFSPDEMKQMVDQFEMLGFTEDAAVTLDRRVRHNSNLNWLADDMTLRTIWDRCKDFFMGDEYLAGKNPIGLNGRFRVYKYEGGDFFSIHTDGSWPGSRVVDGRLVQDAFPGTAWSSYSLLIFLTDDFEGGSTDFLVNKFDPIRPAQSVDVADRVSVKTPVGGVLVFPHGEHPLHCLHAGSPVTNGVKYIIRADVLVEL
mmetsp:Transcript_37991/g.92473  ORF Transcript_37991/g.92473 Transcript_37991/m.92473 type:complete len:341 (-) Transcript_37991:157-1179(-)